jgi:hypothetical protein
MEAINRAMVNFQDGLKQTQRKILTVYLNYLESDNEYSLLTTTGQILRLA